MSMRATEHVIHFPESYLDYDKPWGNRRQVLVTDQHANILSNFLAILLAIAGNGVYNIWRRYMWSRVPPSARPTTACISGSSIILTVDTQSVTIHGADAIHENAAARVASSNHEQHAGSIGLGNLSVTTASEQTASSSDLGSEASLTTDTVVNDADSCTPRSPARTYDPDGDETVMIDRFGGPADLARYHLRKCGDLVVPIDTEEKAFVLRIFDPKFWRGVFERARDTPRELLWHVGISSIALTFYFGTLIVAILGPSPVVGDSTALSRHPACGLYLTIQNVSGGPEGVALRAQYFNEVGRESRQYAKLCYGPDHDASGARDHDSCSYFYQRKIDYSIWEDEPCPFRAGADPLCLGGEHSAYTLSTGSKTDVLVDASVIGINSQLPYKFHRSITCSPLKTDGYVQAFKYQNRSDDWENGVYGLRYAYGSNNGSTNGRCTLGAPNCTFEWPYYPDGNRPYIMLTASTLDAVNRSEVTLWEPIFEVHEPAWHTASHLILISNIDIIYPRASSDPIFIANKTFGGKLFYPDSFKAGVLGCMSRDSICRMDTEPAKCLRPVYEPPDSLPDGNHSAPWNMIAFSTITGLREQLGYLRAENLDAQSLLHGSLSAPLLKDQWKHEVRQMFETVLARTQIEARNLARGRPGKLAPGLEKKTLADTSPGFCTQYKFHAVGWKNISVSYFLGEFFGAAFLCFVGLTNDKRELRVENLWKKTRAGVWKICAYCGPKLWRWFSLPLAWISNIIGGPLAKRRARNRSR